MPSLYLRSGAQKRIAEGHPWVYANQIERVTWPDEEPPQPGSLVDVHDCWQRYLGTGFFNPHSLITVRFWVRNREVSSASQVPGLIRSRIRAAIAYRRIWMRPDTDSWRILFGESDLLPGVIADLFADTLVLQIHALGMEQHLATIADALVDELKPAHVLIKNDEPIRVKESLPLYRRVYAGRDPGRLEIRENGLRLLIDLGEGQKTGAYLDQKANHLAIRSLAAGRRVLDGFCYVGGFALNAAAGGAAEVTGVDQSEQAIALARENAALNGLSATTRWVTDNCFDFLRRAVQAGETYDLIILDPPAFAKSHAAQAAARRGYKEINLSALRLLGPDGLLVTHSCSFHMPEDLFVQTVLEAARDARRTVRTVDLRRQDHDHPVLAGYPESHYLKSLWLQVIA